MNPPAKRQAELEAEPYKRAKIEQVPVTVGEMLNDVALRLRQTSCNQKTQLKEAIAQRLRDMTFASRLNPKDPS